MGCNSVKIVFLPSEKRVYSKKTELGPFGSKRRKFFPFRVDSFSEGFLVCIQKNWNSQKFFFFVKMEEIYKAHSLS